PMRISPDVMFSSPAIMRSSVDLPHPDGPTSTTNSPSSMRTSTPWMTSSAPKAFLTSRIATEAMDSSRRGLSGRPSEARPRALFALRPNANAATAAQDAEPAIGRDYRGNFNSPPLTNASGHVQKFRFLAQKFHRLAIWRPGLHGRLVDIPDASSGHLTAP